MHRQTLQLDRKLLGPEHPSTLGSMNNLASVQDKQGRYDEAEAMHRQTLELREKVLGPEHPSTLDSKFSSGAAVLLHTIYVTVHALWANGSHSFMARSD